MSDIVERLRARGTNPPCDSDRYDAADEIERLRLEVAFKQARIDALMLEFCPDDMTPEQKAEWERHQVVVSLTGTTDQQEAGDAQT